jgi:hypothetical protein
MLESHQKMLQEAAALLVAIADDSGESLVDVVAATEQFIAEKTKVGDAAKLPALEGRRGYTLVNGRLVELRP